MIRINLLPGSVRRARKASGFQLSQLAELPLENMGKGIVALMIFLSVWLGVCFFFQKIMYARYTDQAKTLQTDMIHIRQVETSLSALKNRAKILNYLRSPESQWAPRLNLLSDVLVARLWFNSLSYVSAEGVEASPGKGKSSSRKTKETVEKEEKKEKKETSEKASAKNSAKKNPKAKKPKEAAAKRTPKIRAALVLKGSALVTTTLGEVAPVSRYIERLKEHANFKRYFNTLELKEVEHRQVGPEEVSDFVILLYPKEL